MAFSLEDIKKNEMGPPRIIIYGTQGIGKTSFAASAPKPVFIQTEDGLGEIDVPAAPLCSSLKDLREQLDFFAYDEHDFETLALDGLDATEPLIWDHVCASGGKKSIGDFAFGKGYDSAVEEWRVIRDLVNKCRDRGMLTIMIAHAHVVRFESPESEAYDRYDLRLHRKASALWTDWADAVLFANFETKVVSAEGDRKRAVGKGARIIHTEERPAYKAKNRYSLPEKIPLSWKDFSEKLG